MIGYMDSNYAGNLENKKLIIEYYFFSMEQSSFGIANNSV